MKRNRKISLTVGLATGLAVMVSTQQSAMAGFFDNGLGRWMEAGVTLGVSEQQRSEKEKEADRIRKEDEAKQAQLLAAQAKQEAHDRMVTELANAREELENRLELTQHLEGESEVLQTVSERSHRIVGLLTEAAANNARGTERLRETYAFLNSQNISPTNYIEWAKGVEIWAKTSASSFDEAELNRHINHVGELLAIDFDNRRASARHVSAALRHFNDTHYNEMMMELSNVIVSVQCQEEKAKALAVQTTSEIVLLNSKIKALSDQLAKS